MSAFRLPFSFDPQQLQADLQQVAAEEWIGHYRNDEYEGDWALAPLRSVAGHPAVIHASPIGPKEDFYKNTPLLERCSYFKQVLAQLKCRLGSARLMRLGAGARILEHSDDMGQGAVTEVRLHIPVQTNDQVRFMVDHQPVIMQVGEMWYADFSKLHSVENNGAEPRIHLVVDCLLNDWLKNTLITCQISQFLQRIGIETRFEPVPADAFLPGISIKNGIVSIDLDQLKYPGDILHEAGHIAVTPAPARATMTMDATENDPQAMGQEIATIIWSYAALQEIGLPADVVFHPHGYKGCSDWHIENFTTGNYVGLPLLKWMGMTDDAFPKMLRWLR